MAAADEAAKVLRPLVRRRTQFEHLIDVSGSRPATAKLRTVLEACETDVQRLASTITAPAATVASLVDAASDAAFERQVDHLRRAIGDLTALVAAFDDISKIEETAGLRSGSL